MSGSGNTLNATFGLTFLSGMPGPQNIYMLVVGSAGSALNRLQGYEKFSERLGGDVGPRGPGSLNEIGETRCAGEAASSL